MRIVFMGTPVFAVPSLFAVAASGADIPVVYTRPDAVSGRGRAVRAPAVKVAALELGVPVRQPATLRDPPELDALALVQADLIVVAAYGAILPPEVLESSRLGAINVHASLLPRWRGAAPIQRAILAGDEFTGVSIMRIETGLDTGPYCTQVATAVDAKTGSQLTDELAGMGAHALRSALRAIEDGTARWEDQNPSFVTYAEKVSKSDVAITPDMTALEAERRVRASMPASPCRILVGGRGVTLIDARVSGIEIAAGTLAETRAGLAFGLSDSAIEVLRLKPDGKYEMEASAWGRGLRDLYDIRWERNS